MIHDLALTSRRSPEKSVRLRSANGPEYERPFVAANLVRIVVIPRLSLNTRNEAAAHIFEPLGPLRGRRLRLLETLGINYQVRRPDFIVN